LSWRGSPESEGGWGVADVILGGYEFEGTLPVTWLKIYHRPMNKAPSLTSGFGLTKTSSDVVTKREVQYSVLTKASSFEVLLPHTVQ